MERATTVIAAFELLEQIGAGGMGTIWRGRHVDESVDVALKLVTATRAGEPAYRDGFRREVEAVAGLSHVGIVAVYDYGEVGELAAATSNGELVAGTPWLAMELAELGNLEHVVIESWSELRVVLYDLLDALAHAHSRGVIHRDLKPANVLVTETADAGVLLKLSDFGIAHSTRQEVAMATDEVVGTPTYMAPEQFLGRPRDQGPWTDLYALGAMVYESVCGQPPFERDGFFALATAHLREDVPPLAPQFELPPAAEEWVVRLLAKQPQDRFACAADARWALERLDPLEAQTGLKVRVPGKGLREIEHTTSRASERTLPFIMPTIVAGDDAFDRPEPTESFGKLAPRDDRPPIPARWEVPDVAAHTRALLSGVGLGLFGLRAIPFVGRVAERDVLWQAMRAVDRERRPRAVVVEGPAGCGKSRLVEWTAQRATQVGAATVLSAFHDSMSSGSDALSQMLASHLRCRGLDRREIYERLGHDFGDDAAAVASLLTPADGADDGTPNIEFGSDHERYLAADTVVARDDRVVMIWLDDAQWGADLLEYALHVLDSDARVPVLIVATARSEAIDDREREGELLRALQAHERSEQLELAPLDAAERRSQIERMLRLPADVVAQVASRSEGNPLFAVQLVGDWVQRGVLVRGESGFELSDDAMALPDDIHGLWLQRLGDLEDRFGTSTREAMRIAAAIGDDLDSQTWRLACEAVGIAVPPELEQALVKRRLAVRIDRGLRFAHRMFRESIERDARDAGAWARCNSACAAILELLHPEPARSDRTRIAQYLRAAGALEDALDHLVVAAAEHLSHEELGDAQRAVELAEAVLVDAMLPADDERNGLVARMRARLHRYRGEFAQSDALIEHLLEEAVARGWKRVEATALFDLGSTVALYDDASRGREMLLRAVEQFGDGEREHKRAEALKHLSHVYALRGDARTAGEYARDAFKHFTLLRDTAGKAWCMYYLGLARRVAGDLADSERRLGDALDLAERGGLRDLQANCHNVLADLWRMSGDFEAAADGYQRAERLWTSIGSSNVAAARFNVALSELQRGRFDEATSLFTALCEEFRRHEQRIPLAATHVALIACAAYADEAADAEQEIATASQMLAETGLVDPDVLYPLELAARWFTRHGRTELAAIAARMAQEQREALRPE